MMRDPSLIFLKTLRKFFFLILTLLTLNIMVMKHILMDVYTTLNNFFLILIM